MRCQLGPLGDNRGIKIADPEFPCLRQANNMFKQQHAVDPLIRWVGIWKVAADITKTKGAENRVADRMQQNISVRVAQQPVFVGNRHSTQNQRTVRDQTMNIKTVADTHHVRLTSPAASKALARARSAGVVILRLWGCPAKTATGQPHHSINEASSVPT